MRHLDVPQVCRLVKHSSIQDTHIRCHSEQGPRLEREPTNNSLVLRQHNPIIPAAEQDSWSFPILSLQLSHSWSRSISVAMWES